jgi:acetylornithine deacetylase/succinyl-diaminopimelate desuccinylase-like protein
MTGTTKLLRELIALPSVNPAYLPEASPYTCEERVARHLADYAQRARLDAELQPILPHRPNILIRLAPPGKIRQRILLAPHLDTVGGTDLPGDLFTPRIKGNRLYGRGACDTKASVAVMLCALMELAQSGRRPANTEICFAGLIDEECGQLGSRALVKRRMKADLAIVGEPTRLRVITAHKGVVWHELQTTGRAAHGSHPELGINAVEAMSQIVLALLGKYAARLSARKHPLLGPGTINVGAIQGGTQANIVPAQCRCLIDRRTLPGETDASVAAEILKIVRSLKLQERFTSRNIQSGPCFPLQTDPKLPIVNKLLRAARQTETVTADYFSDAGVLSAADVPSVLFGPGDIAQAHTPGEWIEIAQLERAKNVLVKFLCQLP